MMKKDLKVHQTDKVYFEHIRDKGWRIHKAEGSKYMFSESNTWTTDVDNVRIFDLLHTAVNLAKRRCFRFEIPEYTYEISNDAMHIYYEGNEIGHVLDIKSEKQANDKMKELFHIQPSKMEMLL